MFRCHQIRKEAAQVRGRIELRASRLELPVANLMNQLRTLARHPAAMPVAFVCGILVERLRVTGKCSCLFLAGQMKAMQIVSLLIGYPVR